MALALNEEHRALAGSVRGWAGRSAPPGVIRDAIRDGGAALHREVLRPGLAAQGLAGLHLPESAGGQGYGLPELSVALEELGRALLPGPYLPTVLASAVLSAAGVTGKLLSGLADGSLTGAVSLATGITATGITAGVHGTGVPGTGAGAGAGPAAAGPVMIDGACGPVLGASLADLVILPVHAPGGEAWAVVDAADLEIAVLDSLDLTRPVAQVRAERVSIPADRMLAGLTRATVNSLAAVLFSAEACGIAGWAVDTAAGHARVRHQFGRPIGQFQAVKHRCSWMLTAAELAAAAAWDAARAISAPGTQAASTATNLSAEAELAAGVAAVVALDAAVTCTHECIQVLGGIGYTWEHDAHLYYRRALSLRALLGPAPAWAQRVAALALAGTTRTPQVDLPGGAEELRERIRGELAGIAGLPGRERAGRLADGGWVAPHLPRPWGRGAGPLEQIVIAQEMRVAGVRPPGLAIGAWVVPALVQYGTAEQQQRFLPATLRGEITWCQLFSEPGAGSDLAGLSTRAERVPGGWRLTGQKVWTSLAKEADWAICVARSDPAAPRHDGITYFLVDMAAPGVEVRPLRELTGDAMFNEVFLDGVAVPDGCVVGEVNDGWRVARTTMANERVSLSDSWTFGCGVPELLGTVRELGAEPGQAVLAKVGHLTCEGHAIDVLGKLVTHKQLSGTEPGATGSVRKLLGMRHAQRVAEACWEMTGAEGALADSAWARQMLFTRALTIGGGTTDIQLNIIGERMLGLPRDPDPPPR